MTHPDIVQRLQELLEKATPEWEACDPGDYGDFDGDSRMILGGGIEMPIRVAVFHWHDNDDWREENDANIELAVEARNHLPSLLTEITTLRQQLAEAREALALMSPNWHPGDFA